MTKAAAERIRKALEAESAAWARRHLAADVVGWLTTVAADGRVQSSPVSFLWDGETVLVYSKPDAPKIRNTGPIRCVPSNIRHKGTLRGPRAI